MAKLLTTEQMAEFASSGCLFFEELIDKETNKEFLDDIGHTSADKVDSMETYNKNIKATSSIPRIKAGSPLKNAYPVNSPLEKISCPLPFRYSLALILAIVLVFRFMCLII